MSLLTELLLIDEIEKYSDDQPRDDHGEWTSGGSGGSGSAVLEPSDKMLRAIKAYKSANAKEQRMADKTEAQLSKSLGIKQTRDNSAFDLRNDKVGVEVKTLLKTANDKITMNKTALARKVNEASKDKIKTFTVVADKRGGATKFYIAPRLGSLRIGSMQRVSISEMKSMIHGKV